MSKFKGTPGPWGVRESSLSVSVVGQNGEVVFHESDKRIPGVMDDARLIAAAPELLEALDDLIHLAESAMLRANYDGGEYDIDGELSDARAAIAKALGEDME